MIAKLGVGRGLAEGASCAAPGTGTKIVGKDFRYGDRPFVTGIFIGFGGGPALRGHDGWLTYMIPAVAGVEPWNSVEVIEKKCPIIVEKDEIYPDSGGAGQWDGAPGFHCVMRPREKPASFSYLLDSNKYPAKGLLGGGSGGPAMAWKMNSKGEKIELPRASTQVIQPDEKIAGLWAGGGGYGDPLDRAPERVAWRVLNGWITLEKAESIYGVVIDTSSEEFAVDRKATEELRSELRRSRVGGK
jgi:N-methylhydantoinase B